MDDIGNFAMTTDDGKTHIAFLTGKRNVLSREAGDEVAALVPKGQSASWAAVGPIIKTGT